MTGDARHELQAIIVELEGEEADQQAAHGYAPPRLSRAIARLQQLAKSSDIVAGENVPATPGSPR
jgi:hypothetical protein